MQNSKSLVTPTKPTSTYLTWLQHLFLRTYLLWCLCHFPLYSIHRFIYHYNFVFNKTWSFQVPQTPWTRWIYSMPSTSVVALLKAIESTFICATLAIYQLRLQDSVKVERLRYKSMRGEKNPKNWRNWVTVVGLLVKWLVRWEWKKKSCRRCPAQGRLRRSATSQCAFFWKKGCVQKGQMW